MESKVNIPQFLLDELANQYDESTVKKIIDGYMAKRAVTLRVNTIKADVTTICNKLLESGIECDRVPWSENALIVKNAQEKDIQGLPMYENGEIYLQSLSSMLPPIILGSKENTDILDMAAAPGGKTTELAALTSNKAHITACEMNTIRAERLKYNINKQGASCVSVLVTDARQLDDFFAFDQVLLDAPCSGSGTISFDYPETYSGFSQKLIQKSTSAQIALLKKALKVLKSGHEMVYSTCSILSKENEEIICNAIKGQRVEIVPIKLGGMESIPLLPCSIEGALCVCPNELYEGFFVVKIKKA